MTSSGMQHPPVPENQRRVLEGIRVVDLGRVLAAPHCAQLLADLGADVVKIERPVSGDDTRANPYQFAPGVSGGFMQQNWGKRSVSLDLKHPDGQAFILQLIAQSDVVVENFRPGVMGKLGLGYEALRQVNPSIVLCSISAFGQTGPYSQLPGYGPVVEAIAGLPDLTGEPNGPPMPTAVPIADMMGATAAFGAICAALFYRERTGIGQHIDISLLDVVFQMHETAVQLYLASGGKEMMTRRGTWDATWVPSGLFEGRDGWISLMCGNDTFWRRLAACMGRAELAADTRHKTVAARAEHQDEVYALVATWVKSQDSCDHVIETLRGAEIPCAKVNTIADAVLDPQILAREMLVSVHHPRLGAMTVMNSGIRFSETAADVRGMAPELGEHNRMIALDVLGMPEAEYDRLVRDGVLYAPERERAPVTEQRDRRGAENGAE